MDRSKHTFFQVPKLLVHGEKYKNLDNSEIMAYALLLDRLNVSIKNNWVDKNGNIYFIYKPEKLCNYLGIGKTKFYEVKRALKNVNLLTEERTGNGNRMYLLEPEPTSEEEAKYIIELEDKEPDDISQYTEEQLEQAKKNLKQNTDVVRNPNNADKTASEQGKLKNELSAKFENRTSEVRIPNTSNKNLIRTKDYKDYKESYDDQNSLLIHSFKKQMPKAESDLINIYIQEYNLLDKYGERIMRLVSAYSFDNFDQFVLFMSKFHYALKSAEKELNTEINIENIENKPHYQKELEITFMKTYQKHKAGEVDNLNNYLFTAIKNAYKDAYTNIQSGEYDKQENERKTSTSRNKPIRKETVPNWAKDTSAQKEADDDKLVSEEKQAEFKERLEALRKTRKNVSHNSN